MIPGGCRLGFRSRRRIRRLGGVIGIAWGSTLALPASAALDPSMAPSDVEVLRAESPYTFCKDPRLPLSFRAQALCPHATEIAACEGFAAACKAEQEGRNLCEPPATREERPWVGRGSGSLGQFLHSLASGAIWLFVGGFAAAFLAPAWAALRRSRRDRQLRDDDPESKDQPSRERARPAEPRPVGEAALLATADRCAAAGDNTLALQLYLAASLCALDRRGAVRLAEGRTNGEYVRQCEGAEDKQGLREIVREVERVQFGRQDAPPNVVAAVAHRARTLVHASAGAVALAVLALVLPIVLGACAGGDPACRRLPKPGDDPAGLELFYGVLRRQHVKIEPLGQSLASLPVASSEGPRPSMIVVVDLERTALDEETQDHLMQWVRSGGELVLAGEPGAWSRDLGVVETRPDGAADGAVTAATRADTTDEDDDDDQDDDDAARTKAPARAAPRAQLVGRVAFQITGKEQDVQGSDVLASFQDGSTYAARLRLGHGHVLGIASDELFTNAGLSRPENAAAMVALMSSAARRDVRVAEPHQGVAPPSAPWTSLRRAGLGLGLIHAMFAIAIVFLSVGLRLSRPRSPPLPRRRRFTEHVRAVGALYASTGSAAHALSAYTRFAQERLRARMPRGSSDVAAFLASRTTQPLDRCRTLWTRALEASSSGAPAGDELAVLKELSIVCSAAMAQDN